MAESFLSLRGASTHFSSCLCVYCRSKDDFYNKVREWNKNLEVREREKVLFTLLRDTPVALWLCVRGAAFAYVLGKTTVKKIRSLVHKGLTELPSHGNVGRAPRALPARDLIFVHSFFEKTEKEATQLPWRDCRILPERFRIWRALYEEYRCNVPLNHGEVSERTFHQVRKEQFPYLKLDKAEFCFCTRCKMIQSEHSSAVGVEREQLVKDYVMHRDAWKAAQEVYRRRNETARKSLSKAQQDLLKQSSGQLLHAAPLPGHVAAAAVSADPKSLLAMTPSTVLHQMQKWAADGALRPKETAKLPMIISGNYKEPMKGVQFIKKTQSEFGANVPVRELFGIFDEVSMRAMVYVHGRERGHKNSNHVANLLLIEIAQTWCGQRQLTVGLDNATSQNKNATVVGLLYYIVQLGLFEKVELSFMVAGHSKFSPDRVFGAIASKVKNKEYYTDADFCTLLREVQIGREPLCVVRVEETQFLDFKTLFAELGVGKLKGIMKQRRLVLTTESVAAGKIGHSESSTGPLTYTCIVRSTKPIVLQLPKVVPLMPTGVNAVSQVDEIELKKKALVHVALACLDPEVAHSIHKKKVVKDQKKAEVASQKRKKEEVVAKCKREREEIRDSVASETARKKARQSHITADMVARSSARNLRAATDSSRMRVGSTNREYVLRAENAAYHRSLMTRKRQRTQKAAIKAPPQQGVL